jgi:hypothetical protein
MEGGAGRWKWKVEVEGGDGRWRRKGFRQKDSAPRSPCGLRGADIKGGGCLLSRFHSTIGASGLNFSVRDGKRWDPAAVTTQMGVDASHRHGKQHGSATQAPAVEVRP